MSHEEHSAQSNEVAKGTALGLIGNGIFKLMSFVYTIYIARVVSQQDIGLFYLAFSLICLFGAWKSFGLPLALQRYVPYYEARGEWGKIRGLIRLTYAVNAISGVALAAICFFAADAVGAFYSNPGLPDALRLLSLFLLLDNIFSIHVFYFQGRANIGMMQTLSNLQSGMKLALTFLFFQIWGASLATMSLAFIASYAVAIIVSAFPMRKSMGSIPQGAGGSTFEKGEILKEIVPFGLMLTLISVLWLTVSYADRVVLGYLLPGQEANGQVAVYSMAMALAVNVMIFPQTVGNIFLPVISRLVGKNDMDGVRRTMGTAQRWVLFITIPFAAVMVAFSQEMLSTFYGRAYLGGAAVMAIFVIGLLFSIFTYIISLALAGMRKVELELKIAAVNVLLNVALCFVLIPVYGLDGAAYAAAISFAVSAFLFSHYGYAVVGFKAAPGAYKLFAAGFGACAAAFMLKPFAAIAMSAMPAIGGAALQPYFSKAAYLGLLGVVTAASFAVYGLFALLLKCFAPEDISLLKSAAKKARIPESAAIFATKFAALGVQSDKRN